SVNGTNAAKNTVATFSKAGAYTFTVTIADSSNLTITSSVNVTVNQTLTSITVTPANASVPAGGTQQYSATGNDQFGNPLASQPAWTWSVTGAGNSISPSGLLTAGSTTGSFTVAAKNASITGSTGVTITAATASVVARLI